MARTPELAEEGESTPSPSKPTRSTTVSFDERDSSTYAAQSTKVLRKQLTRFTEEYQYLASDTSSSATHRKVELFRVLRALQDVIDAREEMVEVVVPRSVTGEPFIVGPKTYPPGRHVVRASVASYLLWLIGENQRIELNRLKQNGRDIDLGTIGSRAKQVHDAIVREAL
jgi:hypothetical protein